MDRQLKADDNPLQTIAKTVPGEFTAMTLFVRSFLGVENEKWTLMAAVFISFFLPAYAAKELRVTSKLQIALMYASYWGWVILLLLPTATGEIQKMLGLTDNLDVAVRFFIAITFILQFGVPFLIKPGTAPVPAPDANALPTDQNKAV